jgi:fructose-specific phosphotransferase system IIC component
VTSMGRGSSYFFLAAFLTTFLAAGFLATFLADLVAGFLAGIRYSGLAILLTAI